MALTDQMQIHVLQLSKWSVPADLNAEVDAESAWLYFFKEARGWRELPTVLHTRPLEMAMNVLKQFSENEADWHRYQAREHWLHLQATLEQDHREIREENARLLAERAQIEQEKAQEAQRADQAEQEKAQEAQRADQAEQEKAQEAQRADQAEQEKAQEAQRADQAEQEKAQAEQRAERLLAKLRVLGLEE